VLSGQKQDNINDNNNANNENNNNNNPIYTLPQTFATYWETYSSSSRWKKPTGPEALPSPGFDELKTRHINSTQIKSRNE